MMKRAGIVSYNIYGNFTNYGSALQSYALQRAVKLTGHDPVVVDYCPDCLLDKDPLNPMGNMWDTDPEARERCRLTLPAIRENYAKFQQFYREQYPLSKGKYTSANFNDSLAAEKLDGYICGSDTVFAVPEFGFDDGFYANYPAMRGRSVAYAASFGDYDVPQSDIEPMRERFANFRSIALRENDKLPMVRELASCPVHKVIDPTLLLTRKEYDEIAVEAPYTDPYLLLYSRRGNEEMQRWAEDTAAANGWRVVEISLNARNGERNIMRYDAGVEEFIGLVRGAQMVVTNSFHGMLFAVQYSRPFKIFSRKLCDTKIAEVMALMGITDGLNADWADVHSRLADARQESLAILKQEIELL